MANDTNNIFSFEWIQDDLFVSLDNLLSVKRKQLHDLFVLCFDACPWLESISFSLEREYNDQGGYYSVDFGDSFNVEMLCVGDKESFTYSAENGKVDYCPVLGTMPNGDELCKQFDATFTKLLSKLNANMLVLLFGLEGEITINRESIQSSQGVVSVKKALDVLTSGDEY